MREDGVCNNGSRRRARSALFSSVVNTETRFVPLILNAYFAVEVDLHEGCGKTNQRTRKDNNKGHLSSDELPADGCHAYCTFEPPQIRISSWH